MTKEKVITEMLMQIMVSHLPANEDSLHKYCLAKQDHMLSNTEIL